MDTGKRAVTIALILLSSGFAYAFGRQQATREVCEEFGVRLEALHATIRPAEPDDDAADPDGDAGAAPGPAAGRAANRPVAAAAPR